MVMLMTVRLHILSVKYGTFRELYISKIQYVVTLIHKAEMYVNEF